MVAIFKCMGMVKGVEYKQAHTHNKGGGRSVIGVSSDAEDRRIEILLTLRRYRSKVAEYQACRDLYNQLFPSGITQMADMPKSVSDAYEPERWAQKRWGQRDRMEQSLNQMREALEDIEQLVDVLDGDYKTVVLRRYLLNESYEQIADKLHYSLRTIKYKHRQAIEKIALNCTK